MLDVNSVVRVVLSKKELNQCIDNAKAVLQNIVDRGDLHNRDELERFNNILMGEVAEAMVLKWLHDNGKQAKSSVNKNSGTPDAGHDIEVVRNDENSSVAKCSVKSSLTFSKSIEGIINEFKLATTKSELRDINIQVYFWLELFPPDEKSRITVSSLKNSAIIGWFTKNDLPMFNVYNHENRQVAVKKLSEARAMITLLKFLK